MIWPIVFVIACLIYLYHRKNDVIVKGWLRYLQCKYCFAVPVICMLGIGIIFGVIAGTMLPKKCVPEPQVSVLNGTLLLDHGKYYFCYKVYGNVYKVKNISAAKAIIHEENRQDAVMQKHTYRFTRPIYKWAGITLSRDRYDFFIPEGTLRIAAVQKVLQ